MGRANQGDQRLAEIFAKHMVKSSHLPHIFHKDLYILSLPSLAFTYQTWCVGAPLALKHISNSPYHLSNNALILSYQTGFRVRHLTIKGLPEKQPSLAVLQVVVLSFITLFVFFCDQIIREKVYPLNEQYLPLGPH